MTLLGGLTTAAVILAAREQSQSKAVRGLGKPKEVSVVCTVQSSGSCLYVCLHLNTIHAVSLQDCGTAACRTAVSELSEFHLGYTHFPIFPDKTTVMSDGSLHLVAHFIRLQIPFS